MQKTILLALAMGLFFYFTLALLSGMLRQPEAKKKKKTLKRTPDTINVQFRKEEDGLHIVIPADSGFEDEDDIFPQIINDVPPDDQGLSLSFWERVASIPLIEDPAEREKVAQLLADKGIIPQNSVPVLAGIFPPPEEENEREEGASAPGEATPPVENPVSTGEKPVVSEQQDAPATPVFTTSSDSPDPTVEEPPITEHLDAPASHTPPKASENPDRLDNPVEFESEFNY